MTTPTPTTLPVRDATNTREQHFDDHKWLHQLYGRMGGLERQVASLTTASLAVDATAVGTVTMGPGYRVLTVQVDRACRVRLYTTAAKRDADLNRAIGTDPGENSGLLLEYVASAAGTFELSPVVDGYQNESPVSSAVPISITNKSGAAATVAVTLTYVRTQ